MLGPEPESKMDTKILDLKGVILALKFENMCWGQSVLIATNNTAVVSYINKEEYEIRLSL